MVALSDANVTESIVIAAYNEAGRLGAVQEGLSAPHREVIVVPKKRGFSGLTPNVGAQSAPRQRSVGRSRQDP